MLPHLSRNGCASPSSSSNNQVCFCSNGFITTFVSVLQNLEIFCLSFFFFLVSHAFGGFIFCFSCPISCMCSLHCSSRWFSSGFYSGFLFRFCYFFCLFLENKYALGRRRQQGISVWDVETWPCVIPNLDIDPFIVWILGKTLTTHP